MSGFESVGSNRVPVTVREPFHTLDRHPLSEHQIEDGTLVPPRLIVMFPPPRNPQMSVEEGLMVPVPE